MQSKPEHIGWKQLIMLLKVIYNSDEATEYVANVMHEKFSVFLVSVFQFKDYHS